ncbi:MAG: oxygen-dependent coproporphyrinogen oxidase [Alphaproteobacteria bacterium]|nr:oxygen-dependent coproporphyrinogen oxidase [Alphaproteobacteria bacterium]
MSDPLDSRPICAFLEKFQQEATDALERWEPEARFRRDPWDHPDGSRGETRVLEDGETFEKAGVNFSDVSGTALPEAATERHPELAGQPFAAMGVSIVAHPRNPYVPTAHCNVRFFSAHAPDGTDRWWFGGGFDLTPYYGFEEDAWYWHATARDACVPFGDEVYPRFKEWCDRYFSLPHRGEPRGAGGIFYDTLERDFARDLSFSRDVGQTFLDIYPAIVRRRMDEPWSDEERQHQLVRRGRYVEFNLIHDRGTLFGLRTGGNIEAILMSLPPLAAWPGPE